MIFFLKIIINKIIYNLFGSKYIYNINIILYKLLINNLFKLLKNN